MKAHLAIGLVLLIVSVVSAAERDWGKFSTNSQQVAESKRRTILAEIEKLPNHQWAGEYYAGDGLGVNTSFVAAPDSGFVFEWHGCVGLYDRNYGAVAWTNDRIRLSFIFENDREGFEGIAPELTPVSWGPRHYLIPADAFVAFCNEINQGQEPRSDSHGTYLLRRGDEKKAVSGFPEVPEQYRKYLLANPVESMIIAVGQYTIDPGVAGWISKEISVTLNAGTHQGLGVGMELVITEPANLMESVRITRTEETRAEAVVVQLRDGEPRPKVGWRLSTRAPQHENSR